MNKQIKFGIILQYVQMALSVIINLVYTPLMLKLLGQSEYGIYNLASSIISYLSLLSLGFGSSYIRFYSRYKANNDEDGIKKMNGLYLMVFFVLGAISLISGLLLSSNVAIFFNSTYSSSDLYIAKILMIFLSINLAVSFPASVFVSYITSQEKFIFQKLVNVGKTVFSPIASIVLLCLGYGSIGMVVVTTIVSIIVDIINVWYCFTKLGMKFKFGKVDLGMIKEIALFSMLIAVNSIIDQINWQTDKIILGKMINSTSVAIYAVASTINNMYIMFSTAVSSVFVPKINKIVSENDGGMDGKLTDLFVKVGKIQFILVSLVLTGFIFFGEYFILIWAGKDYGDVYIIALMLMIPVTIPLAQNLGIEIQRAKNLHKFRSLVYLCMAILNVVISIMLCSKLGIIGVTLGTAISLIVANIIIMNIYYHKKININIILFWKNIGKLIPALIIPVCAGTTIRLLVKYNNVLEFLLYIAIYVVVYVVCMLAFGMTKEEKNNLLRKKGENINDNHT